MTLKNAEELIKKLSGNQPAFAAEVLDNERDICVIGLKASFKPISLLIGGESKTELNKLALTKLISIISKGDFLYIRINSSNGNLQFYYEQEEQQGEQEPELQSHRW